MGKELGFLLVIAMLLQCGSALNWQGTGNMSNSNLTDIWTYINANFKTSWQRSAISNGPSVSNFVSGFSTYLNGLWDPAWNVVVVYNYDGSNSDAVLYGYAFNDHWLWYNGVKMDDNYYVTFIIWKDYNCVKWYTSSFFLGATNTYSGTPAASTLFQATTAFASSSSPQQTDIWKTAQALSANM